ncbi:MAG TPA: hypothetical protein VMH02_06815 [Verrucomicrobiae bacterium]|nr:hypothetical protein [Verrucomicrobiae bacterium]
MLKGTKRDLLLVLAMLIASRALIAIAFWLTPGAHFGAVANWDGHFYRKIATSGYAWIPNGGYNTVAFFPLYPLVVRALMFCGLPFAAAGAVVSNAAFAGMIWVAFGWIREEVGSSAARWCAAVLAFFPLSLFGSVTYTESLFMLLSALALREFGGERYGRAALWTALASLTRPTGLSLLPAFAVAALAERRKVSALACAGAAATGAIAFGGYCAVRLGDALAPLHAQAYWWSANGAGIDRWVVLLSRGWFSFEHWRFQLELLPLVAALCFFRRLPAWLVAVLSATVVYVEHWCWDRDFATATLLFLGAPALVYFRKQLGTAALVYGIVAIVTLIATGTERSVDRILYATLPLPLAMAIFFSRARYFGVPVLAAFAWDLVTATAEFVKGSWVA